jgi:K+-transporting ATPase KdpF subunit
VSRRHTGAGDPGVRPRIRDAHKEADRRGDVVFVALTIALFALLALVVRGAEKLIVGLILSIALTIFLIVALVLPEKF